MRTKWGPCGCGAIPPVSFVFAITGPALAHDQVPGPGYAREVRKRLSTIASSRSFVDWQNRKVLVEDLETQRRAIVDQVGRADPAEALDFMWRFMELANSVFERCDDSSGTVIGIFREACRDLGEIASAVKPDA
ncbi:MAG: DUF6880 family protein, partial [bacterium]